MKHNFYTILQTNVTYLPDIAEQINGEIADVNKTLPKNDCNQFAEVASSDATVTSPSFSIVVATRASMWACSPAAQVPCATLNVPKLNYIGPGRANVNYARLNQEWGHTGTQYFGSVIRTQFNSNPADINPVDIIKPPTKPSDLIPSKPTDLLRPPGPKPPDIILQPDVKMCDLPRIKTKLASGDVTSRITLVGKIENNAPRITTSKSQEAHLNDLTNFVLVLLGGSEVGFLSKLGIEKAIEDMAAKKMDIPTEIKIPEAPEQKVDLIWITKSAKFESRSQAGNSVPAFIVVREYEKKAAESLACSTRRTFSLIK